MSEKKCSRCGSSFIVDFSGRCKDMCTIQFHGKTLKNGTDTYEGYPLIFSDNDNLEVSVCLACGQVQGFDWPLDPEYYDFLIPLSKEKFEEIQRVGFKPLDYAHRNFMIMDEEQFHEIDTARDIGVEKWAECFPSEIRVEVVRLMEELIDGETDCVPVCEALADLIAPFISFPEIRFELGRETLMYSVCDGGGMEYEEFLDTE